jgi:uncharacterized lipoprotein YbaY
VIKSQGEVLPMPFEIIYEPGKINAEHTYSIRVKIEDSTGKMLYTNKPVAGDYQHPVHNIDVTLRSMGVVRGSCRSSKTTSTIT